MRTVATIDQNQCAVEVTVLKKFMLAMAQTKRAGTETAVEDIY